MALDALKTVDIIELMENFIERLRPKEEEVRKEIDYGYNIEGQSIFLLEIRPDWKDPRIIRQFPFAKTTYIKSSDIWKIYWMRANLKWYQYDPKPTVKTLQAFLQIVKDDKYNCFFG
ncbi:MAG: DUF3024 domain-containing protein [Terrimonas sp.]|nr:DUF3024 domain-containing protein [Terrimonas sp.]